MSVQHFMCVSVNNRVVDLFPTFYHLDGGDGTFVAFVAEHSATTFLCLLECVAGEQAVDNGNLAFFIQVGQSVCYALTDVIEVWCVASNDTSDGDDNVYQTGADKAGSTIYEFKTAWDGFDVDAFLANAVLYKCFACAVEQCACYLFVPFADHDAYSHTRCIGHGVYVVVREIVEGRCHFVCSFLFASLDVLVDFVVGIALLVLALNLVVAVKCLFVLAERCIDLAGLQQASGADGVIVCFFCSFQQ